MIWSAVPGAYADLVTVAGFKPVVASEKAPGGFDSLPLPLEASTASLQMTRIHAKHWKLTHFSNSEPQFLVLLISRHPASTLVIVA